MKRLKTWLMAVLVTGLFLGLSRLWRIRHINGPDPDKGPYLFAHWHGDELLLVGTNRYKTMAVMTSRSRDGSLMGTVLTWLGFFVTRGSSTRGGAGGLKGMVDAVKKRRFHASLAVDGPRGPIYKVKPGILKLAEQTGVGIIPAGAACDRRHLFKKAWNQTYLPLPLSRGVIVYGELIKVPQGVDEASLEEIRVQLEQSLLDVKAKAEQDFERKFAPALTFSEA